MLTFTRGKFDVEILCFLCFLSPGFGDEKSQNPQTFDAAPGCRPGARTSCRTSICAEVNSMFSMKPCLGWPEKKHNRKMEMLIPD